jgi:predicted RNase H-like HicB family nuclease
MSYYVGILDGSGKTWGVRFPDVDGCVSAAKTPEEAVANASEALRDALAHRRSAGVAVLPPSPLTDIMRREKIEKGESFVMVQLVLDSGRSVRANLTLDGGLLEAIDEAATKAGVTRSAFFSSAAREKLSQT